MAWTYPTTIANDDPPNATVLQRNLDFARRKINSISDTEVAGISEGGSPPRITFDEVSGHTHDGTGSAYMAPAFSGTTIREGAVYISRVVVNVAAISFSTDLITGTPITRVMDVFVGVGIGGSAPNSIVTSPMVDADVNDGTYYAIVNPAGAVDEVFIWNGIASTGGGAGGGVDTAFTAVIIGI